MVGEFDKTSGEENKPFIRDSRDKVKNGKKEEKETPKDTTKFFSSEQADETKKGLDVLFFGDANSGKTYIAHTFPEPIFIIDTERRANKTKQYHFPGKDVRPFRPMEISTKIKTLGSIEDTVDFEGSVDNLTNVLIEFHNKVASGEIKQGTLVVDSMSDVWWWVQEWGKIRLAKKEKIDLVTFRLKQQFDWGMMNDRHYKLIVVMRKLLDYGINLVATAREKRCPEYVATPLAVSMSDRIRAQKDVPFWFSTIINLQVRRVQSQTADNKRYMSVIEKLETFDYKGDIIENLTYQKLKALIDKKREEVAKK